MSYDGDYSYSDINCFWKTHRPRFYGASFLDNLIYAIVNWVEATVGLLTIGYWFPPIIQRYDCLVRERLFYRRVRNS